jgi:hypothetical protein
VTFVRRHGRDLALGALVFVAGVALCLARGRVGYMPLDQSIVWDAGWRMLRGQVPLRDFTAPAGLVPGALQAVAFKAFGVSWLVYVAHAAVFNGAFGVLGQVFLRLRGVEPWSAAACGLLSTVVFYPPFGVPYLEQHSFFFALLAVVLAQAAARWPLVAALVVPALVLGLLSKPIPAALFAPIALAFLPRTRAVAVRAASGAAGALALALVLFLALGMDGALAREALWQLPGSEGAGRLSRLTIGSVGETFARWSLVSLLALLLVRPAARLTLPGGLLAASLGFALLTNNQAENAAACLFLAVGLAQATLASPRLRMAVLALAAVDALRFDARVNAPRLVHSLQDEPTVDARSELPAALSFLRWRLHFFYRYTPADLGRLVAFLRSQPGGVFLLGDSTIVYALSDKDSSSPVLWFHRRLTTPARDTPEFERFEARLRASLQAHDVRLVVLEGAETYDGLKPSRLPVLDGMLRAGRVVQTIGPFTVVEIRP